MNAGPNGVFGSGVGSGIAALKTYFPRYVFRNNVIVGANAAGYPSRNYFPKKLADVRFLDCANGRYALSPHSRYAHSATGGSAPGADVTALEPIFAAAKSGGRPQRSKDLSETSKPALPGPKRGIRVFKGCPSTPHRTQKNREAAAAALRGAQIHCRSRPRPCCPCCAAHPTSPASRLRRRSSAKV